MNRIEQILKEKGISKTEFASMMNTSKQNVNAMFKNPTNAKLEEMADVLEVPVWQLFASPEEVTGEGDLTALIQHKGDFYKATSIAELEKIVLEIKENQEKY